MVEAYKESCHCQMLFQRESKGDVGIEVKSMPVAFGAIPGPAAVPVC